MLHLEDQICEGNCEEMLTHSSDRAVIERSKVGFPHTFELAERRIYWVDSYNVMYCPGTRGLDKEVSELADFGKQYRDTVQFMTLTKAVVEMMTRTKNTYLTSDYLQYAYPTYQFYNWIPNQDIGCLAGASAVASE